MALERDLAQCEAALSEPSVYSSMQRMEQMLSRQESLIRRFEELGGPGFEGEARATLLSLGLREDDLKRPTLELSGGQRKIAVLALCLVQRPELLLLDEPETHLDFYHREQLEALIRSFEGAVIIVSHDRYLLDETVSDIAELNDGAIKMWPGNYSSFALAREVALQRQQELFVSQQKEIARLEEAVKRFEEWARQVVNERHIKQARNKQRQIDKMEKVDRPVLERRKMSLLLRSETRGGQKIFELSDVSMAFDDQSVLAGVNFTVLRGQRVGIIAPNGAGKSVLARILVGALSPTCGTVWSGPSITIGYFAQGHETLAAQSSPLDMVRAIKPVSENAAVAQLLRFLFRYEQVRQPIRTLSGGERSRLQLMLLMLGGANCLVLDEPTNHLDIDSAEILEAALEGYDGSVIVISHDRYFLDRIVDRTIEIKDGRVRTFDGGYTAWNEAHRVT
ncbi:MAG: hypothetical protein NVSMB52_15410 [Chloroflexota bacterium]